MIPFRLPSDPMGLPLLLPSLHLVLFSGKGGVGKTTLASALTRQWAQAAPDRHILLISTDPAHSLGDVWGVEIGDHPWTVPDQPNLQIRSLDAEALLNTFKATYGVALQLIADRGSWFERDDLLPIWDLTWPGVDELMAILEVNRLLAQGSHAAGASDPQGSQDPVDMIVLDTAPTGHTLRLLELPDFLDNLLAVFNLFQAKHQEISRSLTGSYREDEADRFLLDLGKQLQGGKQRLINPESTAAWLVMIPEQLSVDETERFCQQLHDRQVPVGGIVINQVLAGSDPGSVSALYRARQREQAQILEVLQRDLAAYELWISPFQLQEPIGSEALDQLAQSLYPLESPIKLEAVQSGSSGSWVASQPPDTSTKLPDLLTQGIKLVMTGGKGGVGKTTIAGTLAWQLAQLHPDRTILVVSIDPAHSLGDLFETQLSQTPVSLQPNLLGQEIDASTVLEQFRRDYLDDVVAIMAGDSTDIEIQYDPQAWRQLLDMPPPGLDEVMALLTVLEQMEAGEADLVIIDTAPTGHMLRFLQMPAALEGWVSLALKLWVKYRDVIGRPELAQRLRSLLKQIRGLREQLRDPQWMSFIPVLNPEQAVLAETQRLLKELDSLEISHPYAVLNRVWLDPSDPFGQAVSTRHQSILAQLDQLLPNQTVIQIPFLAHPTLEAIGSFLMTHSGLETP